jgi:hypothetical protein
MSTKFRPVGGMIGFTYETELAAHPLDCEIEHEPEERGDAESPGYPAVYRLCSISIAGVDITGLISERLFREIEEAAYDYFEGPQYQEDCFVPPDDY